LKGHISATAGGTSVAATASSFINTAEQDVKTELASLRAMVLKSSPASPAPSLDTNTAKTAENTVALIDNTVATNKLATATVSAAVPTAGTAAGQDTHAVVSTVLSGVADIVKTLTPVAPAPASDAALAASGINRTGTGAPDGLSNMMLSMVASGADPSVLAMMAADHANALAAVVADAAANPATPESWFKGIGQNKFVTLSDAAPIASWGPAPIAAGSYEIDGDGKAGSAQMEIDWNIQFADGTFAPNGIGGSVANFTVAADTTATLLMTLTKNPKILAAMEVTGRTNHLTGGVYTLSKR
jgi:hypothetical protein